RHEVSYHDRQRVCLLVFLMFRRPPRSPLFPSRRSSDLERWRACGARAGAASSFSTSASTWRSRAASWRSSWASGCCSTARVWSRSEEHTSELQSRGHLVCRLLLEKKNAILSAMGPDGAL